MRFDMRDDMWVGKHADWYNDNVAVGFENFVGLKQFQKTATYCKKLHDFISSPQRLLHIKVSFPG